MERFSARVREENATNEGCFVIQVLSDNVERLFGNSFNFEPLFFNITAIHLLNYLHP